MHVDFRCPRCEQTNRVALSADAETLDCAHCGAVIDVPGDALRDDGVNYCVVCRSRDLFVRKDFPQRLGVLIVVIGFAASSVAWYYHQIEWTFGILFATAGIDVVLYLLMGEALVCYRCGAHFRNVGGLDQHAAFDLETHERYRQAAARRESSHQ
jgi:DNA-directed RNA polymerase subunit RPC12/RpoP